MYIPNPRQGEAPSAEESNSVVEKLREYGRVLNAQMPDSKAASEVDAILLAYDLGKIPNIQWTIYASAYLLYKEALVTEQVGAYSAAYDLLAISRGHDVASFGCHYRAAGNRPFGEIRK